MDVLRAHTGAIGCMYSVKTHMNLSDILYIISCAILFMHRWSACVVVFFCFFGTDYLKVWHSGHPCLQRCRQPGLWRYTECEWHVNCLHFCV